MLWSGPAAANDLAEQLLQKFMVTGLVAFAVLVVGSVAFVFAFARLLGLEGGVLAAFLAVLLGSVTAIAIGIVAMLLLFFLPRELLPAVGVAAGMIGGGVGVKVLFKTTLAHGMLVYLLATTCVYAMLGVAIVVMF
jgi:hypothetical protein